MALLATTPFAWAQSAGSGSPGGAAGSSSSGAPGTSGTGAGSPGSEPVAPSASLASGNFMGRHTMTGEVTKVDTQSGKFSLKTDEGTLDLHAPPSALSGVKEGDRMSVEIAVKPMK